MNSDEMVVPQEVMVQLIRLLERQNFGGEKCVEISESNREYLFGERTQTSVTEKPAIGSLGEVVLERGGQPRYTERLASCKSKESNPSLVANTPPFPSPVESLSNALPAKLTVSMEQLEKLARECTQCRLSASRKQTVFGQGPASAQLMFIGDRPSQEDDANGLPFSGKVGELFDKILRAMQLSRDQVYITHIVKCCPPGKRLPADDEACTCSPYLQREIELIEPKVIVLFGAVPLIHLLKKRGIIENRGQWFRYGDSDCMPTYHPSYLLRVPKAKRDVWNDMQAVMNRLNIPQKPE